jgi:crotonobetainyl-CoA:carnitine CoA-transferase CaiB-like acyl-CoA transferase
MYKTNKNEVETTLKGVKGENIFSRLYMCYDGWVFLDSNKNELKKVSEFSRIIASDKADEVIEKVFGEQKVSYWINKLSSLDIAISKINHMADMRKQNLITMRKKMQINPSYIFTKRENNPSGYVTDMVCTYAIQPKEAKIYNLAVCEKHGNSTLSILKEDLNYRRDNLSILEKKHIINQSWATGFLPG